MNIENIENAPLLHYQINESSESELEGNYLQPRSGANRFFSTLAQIIMYPFTACCTCYTLNPQEHAIITSYGQPKKVVKEPGIQMKLFWEKAKKISIAIKDFRLKQEKVNDANRKPILASAVVYWKIQDILKYQYESVNAQELLKDQALLTLREVCAKHPFDAVHDEACLGKPTEEMGKELKERLQNKVKSLGITILNFQFSDVCYEPSMQETFLQKQRYEELLKAREASADTNAGYFVRLIKEGEKLLAVSYTDEEKKYLSRQLAITGTNLPSSGHQSLNLMQTKIN